MNEIVIITNVESVTDAESAVAVCMLDGKVVFIPKTAGVVVLPTEDNLDWLNAYPVRFQKKFRAALQKALK